MKRWSCDFCGDPIEVDDGYVQEYCCPGHDCECYGLPTNQVFCDNCDGSRSDSEN